MEEVIRVLEENLKELIIVKADTKEVLAVIPNKPEQKELIQAKDIDIICNYSNKERTYMDVDGKVYLDEE